MPDHERPEDRIVTRAFIESYNSDGALCDLVIQTPTGVMRLRNCWTSDPPWQGRLTFEICQRWIVGSRIVAVVHDERPLGGTRLRLDNGVSLHTLSALDGGD